jgi:hypothetical protein
MCGPYYVDTQEQLRTLFELVPTCALYSIMGAAAFSGKESVIREGCVRNQEVIINMLQHLQHRSLQDVNVRYEIRFRSV